MPDLTSERRAELRRDAQRRRLFRFVTSIASDGYPSAGYESIDDELLALLDAADERDKLAAAVERVRALHRPIELWEVDPANGTWVYQDGERVLIEHVCEHCTDDETLAEIDDSEYAPGGSAVSHPCPTICALDGTDE